MNTYFGRKGDFLGVGVVEMRMGIGNKMQVASGFVEEEDQKGEGGRKGI